MLPTSTFKTCFVLDTFNSTHFDFLSLSAWEIDFLSNTQKTKNNKQTTREPPQKNLDNKSSELKKSFVIRYTVSSKSIIYCS